MNTDKLKNIEEDRILPKSKTKLAVQRERARLGICNLRQRRCVEELPEQREARLAAERESKTEGVPRNHKMSKKTGLRLIEKVKKESVPRNHKSNLKIIAWHSGTAQSTIIVNMFKSGLRLKFVPIARP